MRSFLKIPFLIMISIFLFTGATPPGENTVQETCISQDEQKLYELINRYRKTRKLHAIPLSKSLTHVAQLHAKDLAENGFDHPRCNLHSWSSKGKWSSCCYTPDHARAQCMWDKPRELSSYSGDGFEIAYFSSASVAPEQALEAWKKSKGHNMIVVNESQWKDFKWNVIGVGIYKGYACVWFGTEEDKEGIPGRCIK